MAVLQKKSTVLLLLALNLAIPSAVLTYRRTHASRIRELPELRLFDSPGPGWVNILNPQESVTVHSNSLNLTLYGNFARPALPSSVTLSDDHGRNVFDEVVFWGGQSHLTSRQLLVQPAFDFYPGPLEFKLSYSSLDDVTDEVLTRVLLIFDDNFASFETERGREQIWHFGPGVEKMPGNSESPGILCEPGEQEKTELVFQRTYQGQADVTVEFSPRTITPNLSVSFSERVSFIIGDGVDNQIKFKHRLGNSQHYYQRIWPIPKLVAGQRYTATLRRRKGHYLLRLTDSALREVAAVSVIDPVIDDATEKYPFIAFWVFSNQMPASKAIKAATEIHRAVIFFPSA